jgi:CheY-like chemotaxis protein
MALILLIDDDENVNNVLLQVLLNAGYEVESVTSGELGLKQLEAKSFDLIITNIIMPGKEGLEIILALRKRNNVIPIIAISGGGKIDPEIYLEMALMLGAAYTFRRPFSIEPFLTAVRKCLKETFPQKNTPTVEKTDQKARRIAIGVASWLCGTLEGLASDNADLALAESLDFWLRLQKKNCETLYIGSVNCISCGRPWECMTLSNNTNSVQCPHCSTVQKITLKEQNFSRSEPENKESLKKVQIEVQDVVTKITELNNTIKLNYEKRGTLI